VSEDLFVRSSKTTASRDAQQPQAFRIVNTRTALKAAIHGQDLRGLTFRNSRFQ
jgi:hypothetical protein